MRSLIDYTAKAIAFCALAAIGVAHPALGQTPGYPQNPGSPQNPSYPNTPGFPEPAERKNEAAKPGDVERQAAMKITSAPDFTAALHAAGEFVKKYPKSQYRTEVARRIVAKAASISDTTQQISGLENSLTVLKEPADAEIINPALIEAYIKGQKFDDAFRVAALVVEKNPNDLVTLISMSMVGIEQAKLNNSKYVPQTISYAPKAIALIEGDKRPTGLDDAQWAEYKTKWLAQLYQSLGLAAIMTRDVAQAKEKLEKSASINPDDPSTYAYLGSLVQEEYSALAQQVKSMLPGKEQEAALKKAVDKMDQIIDLYAHSIGLMEGNPDYSKLHEQLLDDLKRYYAYRHNNSTDGMQAMIDKYKKPRQ